jgi:hypothetical protein
VNNSAHRFLFRPSVQLFRRAIPVSDRTLHIEDENGVVRKIEKTCLFLTPQSLSARTVGEAACSDPDGEECNQCEDVTRIIDIKAAKWRRQPTKPQARKE